MRGFALTEPPEHFDAERGKDEEEEEEEEAEVADLRQGLHHSVEEGADALGHLEELQNWRRQRNETRLQSAVETKWRKNESLTPCNPEYPHDPHDGRVDGHEVGLKLLQDDAEDREDHYHHV